MLDTITHLHSVNELSCDFRDLSKICCPKTFLYGGVKAVSRELLGTIVLNRDESMSALHDSLIERVRKALEDVTSPNQGQSQGSQVGAEDIPLQLIVD